jgi:hypothetical protein
MAWKGDSSATFSGASGQMAVMGELLHRKCNVAIPHADVGTDVFAFRDDREEVARIQVKTAPGLRYKKAKGYHAKFGIPMEQLKQTDVPPLFYALAIRLDNGWGSFVVISRGELQKLSDEGCGSGNEEFGFLFLNIRFRAGEEGEGAGGQEAENEQKLRAFCGKFDLTDFIDAWESLPPLKPSAANDGDEYVGGVDVGAGGSSHTGVGVVAADVQVEDIDPELPQP